MKIDNVTTQLADVLSIHLRQQLPANAPISAAFNKLTDGDPVSDTELTQIIQQAAQTLTANGQGLENLLEHMLVAGFTEKFKEKYRDHFYARTDIINHLIQQHQFKRYLEIGVCNPGDNFDHIKCDYKVAVDPVPLRNDIVGLTSDKYFKSLKRDEKFDLIFIDGLHHYEQVIRDIENSLRHLSKGGIIVCHDMLPTDEKMQMVPRITSTWTGDCWRAWAYFRTTASNLQMEVIDTDFGVGVITEGQQTLHNANIRYKKMNYAYYYTHRDDLMNVVSVDAFMKRFNIPSSNLIEKMNKVQVPAAFKERVTKVLQQR